MVEWSSTYLCSICNTTQNIVNVLEEGTDPKSGNPYQKMELECGHKQKRLRVSKELTIGYNKILHEIDKQFPNQGQRDKVKKTLSEIVSDVKSIRIPHSSLDKLKRYEKIYNLALPWIMKAIEFAMKNGWFDM